MAGELESDETAEAEEILTQLAPRVEERLGLLRQLISSSDVADAIASTAWAVTLFSNGFRMNVGQVEAFVFIDGDVRLNLVGTCGTPPFVGDTYVPASYASIPQPCCAFCGPIRDFLKVQGSLQRPHAEFVRLAALSPSGRPRKGTSFKKSHSEGLMSYARRESDA